MSLPNGSPELFNKAQKPEVKRLASGTFTVGPDGPDRQFDLRGSVPETLVKDIGRQVLAIFEGAHKANLQFSELVVQYAAFKITARQMRGGAIIFLSPRSLPTVATS